MIIPPYIKSKKTIFLNYTMTEAIIMLSPIMVFPFLQKLIPQNLQFIYLIACFFLGYLLVKKVNYQYRVYDYVVIELKNLLETNKYIYNYNSTINKKYEIPAKKVINRLDYKFKIVYTYKNFINNFKYNLLKIKLTISKNVYLFIHFKQQDFQTFKFNKIEKEEEFNVMNVAEEKYVFLKLIPTKSNNINDLNLKKEYINEFYQFLDIFPVNEFSIYSFNDKIELNNNTFDYLKENENPLINEYLNLQKEQISNAINMNIPNFILCLKLNDRFTLEDIKQFSSNHNIFRISNQIKPKIINEIVNLDYDKINESISFLDDNILAKANDITVYERFLEIPQFLMQQDLMYLQILNEEHNFQTKFTFFKKNFENMKDELSESISEQLSRVNKDDRAKSIKENISIRNAQEALLQDMIQNNTQIKGLSIILKITGNSQKELDELELKIKNKFKQQFIIEAAYKNQRQFYNFWTLQESIPEKNQKLISIPHLASGGFSRFKNLQDKNGFLKFSNKNGNVFFNKFLVDNKQGRLSFDSYISGIKGSGKTTFVKTLILEYLALGMSVYNLDIKGDFKNITKELGGTTIDIANGYIINPLQITDFTTSNYIDLHINYVEQFFKTIYPSMDEEVAVKLSQKISQLYKGKYSEFNINSKPEEFPIMKDLLNLLDEEEDSLLISYVSKVTTGSYASYFNGYTNIDINNKFINFDVSAAGIKNNEIFNVILFNIFNYYFLTMQNNAGKNNYIAFIFDEAHRILGNQFATPFIERTIREGRSFKCGIDFVSQGIEELNGHDAIYDLITYKIFLKQNINTIPKIAQKMQIDTNSINFLANCTKGQGILVIDREIYQTNLLLNEKILNAFDGGE